MQQWPEYSVQRTKVLQKLNAREHVFLAYLTLGEAQGHVLKVKGEYHRFGW
jgi:hypothetical protein